MKGRGGRRGRRREPPNPFAQNAGEERMRRREENARRARDAEARRQRNLTRPKRVETERERLLRLSRESKERARVILARNSGDGQPTKDDEPQQPPTEPPPNRAQMPPNQTETNVVRDPQPFNETAAEEEASALPQAPAQNIPAEPQPNRKEHERRKEVGEVATANAEPETRQQPPASEPAELHGWPTNVMDLKESNHVDEEDRVPHRLHKRTGTGGWFGGGQTDYVQLFHHLPCHRLKSEFGLAVVQLPCGRRLAKRVDAERHLPGLELQTLPGLERLAPTAIEYIIASCWQDQEQAVNAQQRLVELLDEGVDEEIQERTLSTFHPDPERSFRPLRYVRRKALSGSGFQHPNRDQERPDVRVGDYAYALIRLTTEWTNPRPLTNSHFTDRIAILRRATSNRPAALYDVFNTDYSGIEHLPPFLRHYAHGLTRNREFRYVRYQHLNNIARAFAVLLASTWNPEHLVRTFERPWWLYFASHRGPSPLESIAEKDEQLSLNIKKEILRAHWALFGED